MSEATPNDQTSLTVPRRFRGPSSSGNGGWTSGAVAELLLDHVGLGPLGTAVEVTLRRPPPLDAAMPVVADDGRLRIEHEGATVAEARVVEDQLEPVDPVPLEEAQVASASYAGHRAHPFPGCFACGTGREEGDGLRIFPGPVPGVLPRVAAPWTPGSSSGDVTTPVTWAALDCVGGWSSDLENRPMVLGRMTVVLDAWPQEGEDHVVIGELRSVEGRKALTAATLYDADERVVARARHVWIQVDPRDFGAD
jgi:hypothetical protein